MYVTPHIDSLTEEGAARSRPMKAGDLVIAVSGAPGLPAILKTDACIHDGFVGLRNLDQETVNPEFLYRYLYYVKTQSGHGAVGAIFKNLTSDQIRDLEIPLPPLPEQKRIADILDKADAIRRKRREANELAGTFQHGLFSEMFGDPISNELEWPVKSFGEMASNQDGRRKPIKASDREKVSGEYPYYGASGIIDYVDSYLFDETALLVGEDGANLLARSTPIAFLATGKYWVNNHAHVVTPNGNATLLYLATHLNMRSIRDFVTGSAQPKLNQSNLNKIPIPCPPIELQEEFDRRVSTFDLIRKKQDDADKEVESTFNSLVQRAFKGEL
jgi:type I restriction enzyme S subunit